MRVSAPLGIRQSKNLQQWSRSGFYKFLIIAQRPRMTGETINRGHAPTRQACRQVQKTGSPHAANRIRGCCNECAVRPRRMMRTAKPATVQRGRLCLARSWLCFIIGYLLGCCLTGSRESGVSRKAASPCSGKEKRKEAENASARRRRIMGRDDFIATGLPDGIGRLFTMSTEK